MSIHPIPLDKTAIPTVFHAAHEVQTTLPIEQVKRIVAGLVLAFSAILLFGAIDGLTMPMRLTIAVFVATIVAWTILDLPETPVALTGAVALSAVGAISEEAVYRSLGNDTIWLMLSAFIIAGVLRSSGVIEQVIAVLLSRLTSVSALFWALNFLIFMTAFVIPSTSARAAILMPVFLGLSAAVGNRAVTKALALLFPTIILLSAGASLTGAGAHLVAVDFIGRTDKTAPDFLDWMALAAPFSLLSCSIACMLILRYFLSGDERRMAIGTADLPNSATLTSLSIQQKAILAVVATTVLLFATTSLHGIGMPLVGIAAALVITTEKVSGLSLKAALKSVEWNLLLFLAGTLVIGEALIETGTANLLADRLVGLIGNRLAGWPMLVIASAVLIATFSHLVITSRTARATVLIPAFALPLAALDVNPANLTMVVTLASGFCQTLMVSAKPVTLFGSMTPPAFGQVDLVRLALMLIVPFVLLLVFFSTFVWPLQGISLR